MNRTREEILDQPNAWAATLDIVAQAWAQVEATIRSASDSQLLFIGSGTSLYLAMTAAQVFQEVTGVPARAVPSSDVFLSPDSTVPRNAPILAVAISRSGTTSEALMAVQHLRRNRPGTRVLGITCNPGSPLTGAADAVIELPHANEQSMVMTRSFTSMLLGLQSIAARLAGDDALLADLERLPNLLRERLDDMVDFGETVGRRLAIERVAYLGLGPNLGLAHEATLKLEEMTQVPCAAYGSLEFRHGPISVVDQRAGVIMLQGLREREFVASIEVDIKRHGGFLSTVGPYPSEYADAAVVLPEGLSDIARCVLYLPPVQLLAQERAAALGLNPDTPRHLNPVVVLDAQ